MYCLGHGSRPQSGMGAHDARTTLMYCLGHGSRPQSRMGSHDACSALLMYCLRNGSRPRHFVRNFRGVRLAGPRLFMFANYDFLGCMPHD